MATGGIINAGYTGVTTSPGNGQLDVKYNTVADQSHPTQYSLIVAGVAGPWLNVKAAGSNSPSTVAAQTYVIKFQRTTASPADTAPPNTTATVQVDQKLTIKVKYT